MNHDANNNAQSYANANGKCNCTEPVRTITYTAWASTGSNQRYMQLSHGTIGSGKKGETVSYTAVNTYSKMGTWSFVRWSPGLADRTITVTIGDSDEDYECFYECIANCP